MAVNSKRQRRRDIKRRHEAESLLMRNKQSHILCADCKLLPDVPWPWPFTRKGHQSTVQRHQSAVRSTPACRSGRDAERTDGRLNEASQADATMEPDLRVDRIALASRLYMIARVLLSSCSSISCCLPSFTSVSPLCRPFFVQSSLSSDSLWKVC